MDSALLQVDLKKTSDYDKNRCIDELLNAATTQCKINEGIEVLGQGAWLIDVRKSMPFLSEISHAAHKCGVPYRVLYFAERPNWISYNWNGSG